MESRRLLDGRQTIGCLANNLDIWVSFQDAPNALPRRGMIVDDEDVDGASGWRWLGRLVDLQHHGRRGAEGADIRDSGSHGRSMPKMAGDMQCPTQAMRPRSHAQQAKAARGA